MPKGLLYTVSGLIIVTDLVLAVPAAAMVIVSKVLFALLLAVGPLFIMSLMFPIISDWFKAWFSQVMTQVFTIGFLCMIVSSADRIFAGWLGKLGTPGANLPEGSLSIILKIIAVSILLVYTMYKSLDLAGGLGNGISSQVFTVGGMARGTALGMEAAGTGAGIASRGVYAGGRGLYRAYHRIRGKGATVTPNERNPGI